MSRSIRSISYRTILCVYGMISRRCASTALAAALPPFGIVSLSAVLTASLLLLAGNSVLAQSCDTGCGDGGTVCDDSCSSNTSWPNHCGMAAPMYPVPYDVPAFVGRTEFTYPPVMPHHCLPHYRKVYSYRHGPAMARTTVKWHPSLGDTLKRVCNVFELPR